MKQVNDSISDKLKCISLKSVAEIRAVCKPEVMCKIKDSIYLKINLNTFYELLIKIAK